MKTRSGRSQDSIFHEFVIVLEGMEELLCLGPKSDTKVLDCLLSLLLSGPVQTYKCVYYSASQWAPLRNLLFDILA